MVKYTFADVWLAMLLVFLQKIDLIIAGAITSGHECHTLRILGSTVVIS